jgi:endonuclease-3
MLNKKNINHVLGFLKENYQQYSTALEYRTPFQLLLATMLAAQSTDKRVNMVTRELFKYYDSPSAFLNLSAAQLEEKIKSIGLYKAKAKNILATCRLLIDKYQGKLPASREELMTLPGVGRKTANVVLSITTDFKAIAVDTHVFRVANRLGLADSNNVRQTENQLMRNIPQDNWSAAHHWLIWHGRKICKARQPLCPACFLTRYCIYYKTAVVQDKLSLK